MRALHKRPAFSDKLHDYKFLKNSATYIRLNTQPFKAQLLIHVPPRLTSQNSKFCPHSVFVCFVWISEQTVIISLYSIN